MNIPQQGIIGAAFGDGNNSVNNCENKGTIQVTGKTLIMMQLLEEC